MAPRQDDAERRQSSAEDQLERRPTIGSSLIDSAEGEPPPGEQALVPIGGRLERGSGRES
jgi:hypothetical protein